MKTQPSKLSMGALLHEALRLDDQGRPREAARILRRLASAGYPPAQFSLGVCYDDGRGVARSRARALHWYRLAARRGSALAASNIGNAYRAAGRPKLAERWLLKAVEMGEPGALLDLAKLYRSSDRTRRKAGDILRRLLAVPATEMTEDTREQAEALLSDVLPMRHRTTR